MPSFEGNLLTQRHQITSLETRDSRLSHSEDFMILSCVVLTQYSSVSDRQTEGRIYACAVAKTRYSSTCMYLAVARKKHTKFQNADKFYRILIALKT